MTKQVHIDPGWIQFERMVRGGVPHALNIALALSASDLTVPYWPHFNAREADLAFYAPVHLAYRLRSLPKFLFVMERLRSHPLWKHCLKDSRTTQLIMAEDCKVGSLQTQAEIYRRLEVWVHTSASKRHAADARNNTLPFVPRSDSNAA